MKVARLREFLRARQDFFSFFCMPLLPTSPSSSPFQATFFLLVDAWLERGEATNAEMGERKGGGNEKM